jgi:hypothetical protein
MLKARVDLEVPYDGLSGAVDVLVVVGDAARLAVGDYLDIVRPDYGQFWLETDSPWIT